MSTRPTRYDKPARDLLTDRQQDVLQRIADGMTNGEIADELDMSLDGVKWHIREIFAKLDARTRDEAVQVWNHQNGHRLLRRMSALTLLGAAGVAAVAVVAVAFFFVFDDAPEPGPESDLRVLIAQTLSPEPGFRVIDLPSERERTFAEEVGEVGAVYLSPTGENIVAHIPGKPDQLVFMSYPDGEYTVVTLDGFRRFASLYWSPDGTRAAVTDDHLRIYTATGEPLGEHPGNTLKVPDQQGTTPISDPWSPDSRYLLSGDEVISVLDQDGNVVHELTQEFLNPDGLETSGRPWIGSESRALFMFVFEQTGAPGAPQRVEFIRIDISQSVPAVSTVDSLPFADLIRILVPWRASPPTLLEQLDARVPAGLRAAWEVPIGERGWAVSFEERSDVPDTFPVMLQVGDIAYDFDSPFEVSGIPGKTDIVVLAMPKELQAPPVDIEGCPMQAGFCGASLQNLDLLLAGDIEALLAASAPSRLACRDRFGADRQGDPCFTSNSGISRFVFQNLRGLTDPSDASQSVTLTIFRVTLGGISGRMRNAAADASDEFGPGHARIAGFSCRSPEADPAPCEAASGFNVTWLEQVGGSVRRVVAIFGMSGDGITGLVLLEDPTDIALVLNADPYLTAEYGRSFVLWSPTAQ